MSNPTELPDLDKIEEQVRRAYMADARFVAFLQPGTILDIIKLARRAQPEGEAPQAAEAQVLFNGEWKPASAEAFYCMTEDKRRVVDRASATAARKGARPAMANPGTDVSKSRKAWKGVHDAAMARLTGLGGTLGWSDVAYELMRWVHADLVLIFYPHKTSAGNYHVRVRAGKCKDRKLLRKCILALAENSCNFGFPTEQAFHAEGVQKSLAENRSFTQCPNI